MSRAPFVDLLNCYRRSFTARFRLRPLRGRVGVEPGRTRTDLEGRPLTACGRGK